MTVRILTEGAIGETLNSLPGAAMHHLTILWSAKAIQVDLEKNPGHYCDDGRIGADSAFDVVLSQLVDPPNGTLQGSPQGR